MFSQPETNRTEPPPPPFLFDKIHFYEFYIGILINSTKIHINELWITQENSGISHLQR